MTVMALMVTMTLSAQGIERPRLVVGVMVDQMRWDYMYYYYDQFGEGGIRRLLSEGHSCENTMINYVPTVTAIGHSSVYTGSTPAFTGIAGNDFYVNGKTTTSVLDTTMTTVGAPGKTGMKSPHLLLASTIGDQLKTATDYKAKVVGVALKDRASILPAGHCADAAYWWDTMSGHYVTSSYYMDKLPAWMEEFNKKHTDKDLKLMESPKGVTKTIDLAIEVLKQEQMGKDDVTDLLAVSVSSTDLIGHAYGTRGAENKAVYLQLDKELARLFSALDETVGRGNYLLFLTADHGGMHSPKHLREHKLPSGGWDNQAMKKKLNEMLSQRYGGKEWVRNIMDNRLYLEREAIRAKGVSLSEVRDAVVEMLLTDSDVIFACDYDKVGSSGIPPIVKERICNGYNSHRSGDVYVAVRSGLLSWSFNDDYIGTSHGAWNPYDSHIPLVFMGWHVKKGQTVRETHITDIAATVCAMLHIERPDCCIGDAISEVME